MFTQRVNPTTGKMEWLHTGKDLSCEQEDVSSELASSQYGDMLHDTERNKLYRAAITHSVKTMRDRGYEPRVLDIGTGTGLLAMMAASAGAKHITACEVLKPMARIASRVIADNHLQSVITVISKRSTDMTIGPDGDMPFRANILITEIFDSELIGEGVLPTLIHAHKHLLESDAIVVPSGATVYAQLIDSVFLRSFFSPVFLKLSDHPTLLLPKQWECCSGPPFPWSLHLDQLPTHHLAMLSLPLPAVRFSFAELSSVQTRCHSPVSIPITQSGTCHAIGVWWSLTLAPGVELSLSPWQHNLQWREHWLQCVHYPSLPLSVTPGNDVMITMSNDDYTMWPKLQPCSQSCSSAVPCSTTSGPVCHCGVHMAWSRSRLSMLNNSLRNSLLWEAVKKALVCRTSVLFISDGSLLPIVTASVTHHLFPTLSMIYTAESNVHSAKCIQQLLDSNSLSDKVHILTKLAHELTQSDIRNHQLDALIAEPYYISSLLPWHNLYFWYVRSALQDLLLPDASIVPCKGYLRAIAVRFEHLHELKESVGMVEGFDLSTYDAASSPSCSEPDMFRLWEYRCYPQSCVETLLIFDFESIVSEDTLLAASGTMKIEDTSQVCHGVVLWMDYQLTTELLLSEGLAKSPQQGEPLQWVNTHQQAVYFFTDYQIQFVPYQVKFIGNTGQIDITFE